MIYGNHLISNLVTHFNLGAVRRLRFIKVRLNETSLEIFKILYREGVIRAYLVKNDYILVYYKYYLSRNPIKISVISTPGNRIHWSLSKLNNKFNYYNFSGFYIISTPQGLLSSNNILLQTRISGLIMFKVEV